MNKAIILFNTLFSIILGAVNTVLGLVLMIGMNGFSDGDWEAKLPIIIPSCLTLIVTTIFSIVIWVVVKRRDENNKILNVLVNAFITTLISIGLPIGLLFAANYGLLWDLN